MKLLLESENIFALEIIKTKLMDCDILANIIEKNVPYMYPIIGVGLSHLFVTDEQFAEAVSIVKETEQSEGITYYFE